MLIGCLALAGFPFSAGSSPKTKSSARVGRTSKLLGDCVLLFTAFLTAYYTFRLYFRVFEGPEVIPPPPKRHWTWPRDMTSTRITPTTIAHLSRTATRHDASPQSRARHHDLPADRAGDRCGARRILQLAGRNGSASSSARSPSLAMAYNVAEHRYNASARVADRAIVNPVRIRSGRHRATEISRARTRTALHVHDRQRA